MKNHDIICLLLVVFYLKEEFCMNFDDLSSYKVLSEAEMINIFGGAGKWHYWGNGVYTKGNQVCTIGIRLGTLLVVFHMVHGQMD